MATLDALETQLVGYWQTLETQKTWEHWKQWIKEAGLALNLPHPPNVPARQKINYQTFLSLCEDELDQAPQCKEKLTNPQWLHAQKLVVVPNCFFQAPAGSLPNSQVPEMQQQIAYLSQALKNLQNQVQTLEQSVLSPGKATQGASVSSKPASQNFQTQKVSKPPLAEAGHLEQKLLQQLSSKQAKKQAARTTEKEQEPQPLEEVYLPFNEWCQRFIEEGLAVEQLSVESLRVESQRPISFQQFGHRMQQQLADSEMFQQAHEAFAKAHAEFFPPLPEAPEESAAEEFSPKPEALFPKFERPSSEMYRGFNDWLEWLKGHGIDVREFASHDLKVSSTRQISFLQFCRRLERNLDDVENFRKAIEPSPQED